MDKVAVQLEFYACFCRTSLTANYSAHLCFSFSLSFLLFWVNNHPFLSLNSIKRDSIYEDIIAFFTANLEKPKIFLLFKWESEIGGGGEGGEGAGETYSRYY